MPRTALAALLVAGMATSALANGRPPGTSTINFRKGHQTDVLAGMTFGALISHDSGATWHYICEDAIGYGGMYDPDYVFTASNKLFATTFNGLKINTDGCTFNPTPLAEKFVSSEELAPDDSIYVGMADPHDSDIYKSTDDGTTFPAMTMPGKINDWWQSISIAPSDAQRVYMTGYRFNQNPVDGGDALKEFLLFKSSDAGGGWVPMSQTGITTSQVSTIEVAGIGKSDPNLVYIRVTVVNGTVGDALYRSSDAGATWTQILALGDSLRAFAVRGNGDIVAATPTLGAQVSHDKGATWMALVNPPHLNCLVENDQGELWGCTQNFGTQNAPGDNYGIMKTTDLATWTGVLRYQDILAPVACPAGTVQHDKCATTSWCATVQQLGITSTAVNCGTPAADIPADTSGDGGTKKGCCSTGDGAAPGTLLLGLALGAVILRKRR